MKANVSQIIKRLKGARVFVRADLNVPMTRTDLAVGIRDDTRIRAVLPTLRLLQEHKARIILCSHFGRPKGCIDERLRLNAVADRLQKLLAVPVQKMDDCIGKECEAAVKEMKDGDIVLLENVRFYKEETENDLKFAEKLAHQSDIYVNDAFGTAHRAHASTAGVAAFIPMRVAGMLMEKELRFLHSAIHSPQRPLAAILGGAKISTKIPVLEALLLKCDTIFLGGGMIFTFLRAMGMETGKSIVEEDKIELAKKILEQAKTRNVQFILPTDVIIADAFDADAISRVVPVHSIPKNAFGMDIGPETIDNFSQKLQNCQTIIWNGPMGVFEFEAFAVGTLKIARLLGELTEKGAITVIGGGDSVAAIEEADVADKISHVSTGGGASLELLEDKVLPGVAALTDASEIGI